MHLIFNESNSEQLIMFDRPYLTHPHFSLTTFVRMYSTTQVIHRFRLSIKI